MSDELKMILDRLDKQDDQLSNIESTIGKIAVQDEKILNIQTQITGLWKKYDDAFRPDGPVFKIEKHQASCPKDRVEKLETRSWGMLVSIIMIVLSGLSGVLFFSLRSI